MEFPRDEIKALVAALKAGDWVSAIGPAFVVGRWLFEVMKASGMVSPSPAGTLSSTSPLGDAEAAAAFDGMVSDTPAALDPVMMSRLLQYLLTALLPKILDRLGK